jgi:hypothetical protein
VAGLVHLVAVGDRAVGDTDVRADRRAGPLARVVAEALHAPAEVRPHAREDLRAGDAALASAAVQPDFKDVARGLSGRAHRNLGTEAARYARRRAVAGDPGLARKVEVPVTG